MSVLFSDVFWAVRTQELRRNPPWVVSCLAPTALPGLPGVWQARGRTDTETHELFNQDPSEGNRPPGRGNPGRAGCGCCAISVLHARKLSPHHSFWWSPKKDKNQQEESPCPPPRTVRNVGFVFINKLWVCW